MSPPLGSQASIRSRKLVPTRSSFPDPGDISRRRRKRRQVQPYKGTYARSFTTHTGSPVAGSIHAPIHSLPTEILTHIFSFNSNAFALEPNDIETELYRLADTHLLTLSRVCGHWHHIIMGTPALWTTVNLNGVLWSVGYWLQKTMTLLAARLERTRNALIDVRIFATCSLTLPPCVFELLAQHCHHWRTADFFCSLGNIDLSVLKGRLPAVQEIKMHFYEKPHSVDFFEGAPRLETLAVRGSLLQKMGAIPSKQLGKLVCDRVECADIPRAISLASELRGGSHFHLTANVSGANRHFPAGIAPSVLPISRFSCTIMGDFYARHSARGLGGILGGLTLPNLEDLSFRSDRYPKIISEWPHAQFLELSERSGFHRSLKVLCIAEVLITKEELIAVLSALDSLEYLEIADKQRVDGEGADLIALTDDFLRAMTFNDHRNLVPQLHHFTCATWLHFSDDAFVDFVTSRLEASPSRAFHVGMQFLDGVRQHASLSTLLQGVQSRSNPRFEYDFDG
ncbi:hypothetical protein DFH06DRAFT_737850 [Mycena polygramma]|nr:hypothetical protein DFH06DRAFT_737850 [Mycena polygramma]